MHTDAADMLKRRLKHAAAPLKPLNESPVTPTAGPRNFMTGAARRFYWRTWSGFGTEFPPVVFAPIPMQPANLENLVVDVGAVS